MPVTFQEALVHDMNRGLTIEEIYQMYAAFAGVHKTAFHDLLRADGTDYDGADWTAASGTWDAGEGTAGGVEDVDILWWSDDTPTSFKMTVEVPGLPANDTGPFTIAFRGDGDNNCYLVRVGYPWVAEFWKVTNGVAEQLSNGAQSGAEVFDGPGTLEIVVSEKTLSNNEGDRWLFMSVWMDGKFLLTAHDNIPDTQPGRKVGLAIMDGDDPTEYGEMRIPDLSEIVPYATIDPDETAQSAIQRAIVDRVLRHFIRFDGTLVAWRPKASAIEKSFELGETTKVSTYTDTRDIANHIRMYYLLSWVESFDDESIELHGRRFREMTSAVIESEEEAYSEAEAMIRRSHQNANTAQMTSPIGGFFVEPEDRVEFPGEVSYIVGSLSWSYRNHRIYVDIDGRSYLYDE